MLENKKYHIWHLKPCNSIQGRSHNFFPWDRDKYSQKKIQIKNNPLHTHKTYVYNMIEYMLCFHI